MAFRKALGVYRREQNRPNRFDEPPRDQHQTTLFVLRRVISRWPDTQAALSARAMLAALLTAEGPQKDINEGVRLAERLVRDAPDTWQAGWGYSNLLLRHHVEGRFELEREHGNRKLAEQHLRRGIEAGEKALARLARLTDDEWRPFAETADMGPRRELPALCHLLRGLCFQDLQDFPRAEREWKLILEEHPDTFSVAQARKYLARLPALPSGRP